MLYVEFLKWVGKQGLKSKVLQKYLNKAWREAEKAGKPIIEKNFPGLLKKAQDFKANFKTFEPKIVPKVVKPKLKVEKSNVIPLFPKKPLGKADGGSVDKALSGRSRDI